MRRANAITAALSIGLVPAGMGVASLLLHDHTVSSLTVYLLSVGVAHFLLLEPDPYHTDAAGSWVLGLEVGCHRIFLLFVLAALNVKQSCPTWFLGLMLSATLMQSAGFVLVRPTSFGAAVGPRLSDWNTLCQTLVLGTLMSDFVLLERYPNNFRFSETFHLAGYAFLAVVQIAYLAQDFYRMRRPVALWIRGLALGNA